MTATIPEYLPVNRETFPELWHAYNRKIRLYGICHLRDTQLADDLVIAVFTRAWMAVDRYVDQGKDPGAWLNTIARNITCDYYTSSQRRIQTASVNIPDRADQNLSTRPDHVAQQHADRDMVHAAIAKLCDEQRECIQLRFIREMSLTETAALMGKTVGAVKALQYRATQTLRRIIEVEP